jgi:hypothetical protein
MFGTLPSGTMGTPDPDSPLPLFAPSAAAISCNSFCGSFSHALNSGTQGLSSNLRRDAHIASKGISSYELHFVDFDGAARPACAQRLLNLLGNILRFRTGHRERTNKADKILLRDVF